MNPPSEAKLAEVERKLRALPRGAQRKVTEGIYMRLERGGGRRRFTYRGLGGLPGGTCDTWAEACEWASRPDGRCRTGVGSSSPASRRASSRGNRSSKKRHDATSSRTSGNRRPREVGRDGRACSTLGCR